MENKSTIILASIILLSLFLRYYDLEVLPRWDWDEGENMNLSWNLLHGKLQLYALTYPFIPHPPLFYIASAAFMKLFGNTLLSLRILTSLYGVLTTIIIYYIGRELLSERVGLLSSFLYAIYPAAIYFNRIAFANNQLMFLYMATVYATVKFLKTKKDRFLYAASFFAGLGIITEFGGVITLASLLILVYMYTKNKNTSVVKCLVVSLAPFALTYVVIIKSFGLDVIKYELTHGTGRIGVDQIVYMLLFLGACTYPFRKYIVRVFKTNVRSVREDLPVYYLIFSLVVFAPVSDRRFYFGGDYFWFGIPGFFLIDRKLERRIMLAFFLPLLLIHLFIIGRSDHMMIPLYPYFALGLSVFVLRISDLTVPYFKERFQKISPKFSLKQITLAAFILVYYPFAVTLYTDFSGFVFGRGLAYEPIQNDRAVVEYVNRNVGEDDVVLVVSHMGTLVKARTSILLQSIAIEGREIAYYQRDIPKERFVFNCSYRNARYVIMNPSTIDWLANATDVEVSEYFRRWQPVYETYSYVVYENPEKKKRQ